MSKSIFIFLASAFLLLAIFSGGMVLTPTQQMVIALGFILFLGIPHGAIDNVLYLQRSDMSNARFIAYYIAISVLNVLLWLWIPALAYVGFLAISAYHFGQSQFTHHVQKERWMDKLLYFSWGSVLLSALIFLNRVELLDLATTGIDLAAFNTINASRAIDIALYASTGLTALLFLLYGILKRFSWETILMELFVMGAVLFCFYIFPFLIGFTLYFVILHALKVMREEYDYLKSIRLVGSLQGFLKLLAPLTVVSLAGIGALYLAIAFEVVDMSYGFSLMVVISSITLPHVFVMERFYRIHRGSSLN